MQYLLTHHLFAAADHNFYQKWAPLTDPTDTRSGVKGYVRASLSVLMKGDALRMPSLPKGSSSGSNEDIEKSAKRIIIILIRLKTHKIYFVLHIILWKFLSHLSKLLLAPQQYYFRCPSWSVHFNTIPITLWDPSGFCARAFLYVLNMLLLESLHSLYISFYRSENEIYHTFTDFENKMKNKTFRNVVGCMYG